MALIRRFKHLMKNLTLSKALIIVIDVTTTGPKPPHWFNTPVRDLIEFMGDRQVDKIKTEDINAWFEALRDRPLVRDPSKKLSPYTADSYGRSVKRFFKILVMLGHLDKNPARRLKLPRLPHKGKKEISQTDIDLMIQYSEINPRDHALVLCLRDSGSRVGELLSISTTGLFIEAVPSSKGLRLRARAMVIDQKTNKARFIFVGHRAAEALQKYLRIRHQNGPDQLWLTHGGKAITPSGVYQALKRIAKRAGIEGNWNPHAFRHALAKRLIEQGANHKALQSLLGHSDVRTTINMYIDYDDNELAELHSRYSGYD